MSWVQKRIDREFFEILNEESLEKERFFLWKKYEKNVRIAIWHLFYIIDGYSCYFTSHHWMERLVKIVRMSSKVAFINLRDLCPIFCSCLWENIRVTNIFLRHVSWSSKKRNIFDIVKRLSTINLVFSIIAVSVFL